MQFPIQRQLPRARLPGSSAPVAALLSGAACERLASCEPGCPQIVPIFEEEAQILRRFRRELRAPAYRAELSDARMASLLVLSTL